MTEITKSTEAKKDEMQVEKEKLESVKRADAAVKTMHDFTSPEVLYKELINSVLKYHPSTDISMIEKADTSRVWSIISTTAEHPASTSRAMRNIRKTCARHVKF